QQSASAFSSSGSRHFCGRVDSRFGRYRHCVRRSPRQTPLMQTPAAKARFIITSGVPALGELQARASEQASTRVKTSGTKSYSVDFFWVVSLSFMHWSARRDAFAGAVGVTRRLSATDAHSLQIVQ